MTSKRNAKRSSDSMRNLLKVPAIDQLTDSAQVISLLVETMNRVNELQEQCDQHDERIAEKDEEI